MKRIVSGGVILSLVLLMGGYSPVSAAITGTFTATETTPNISTATLSFPNLSGGADAVGTTTIAIPDLTGGVDGTAETRATASFTLTNFPGSVDSIQVNGVEILGATTTSGVDLDTLTGLVAAQIESFSDYSAVVNPPANTTVVLTAPVGTGASANGYLITYTTSGIGLTPSGPFSGGINAVGSVQAKTTSSSFALVTSQAGADLTLNIGGDVIALTGGHTGVQAAESVRDAINASSSNPYTALVVNTDQVELTAKASGTAGNAPLVATDLEYNTAAAIAPTATSNSFTTISSGAGADLALNIGSTTITLTAGHTGAQAAVTVEAAINADGLNPYTALAIGDQVKLTSDTVGVGENGNAIIASDLNYNTTAQVVTFTPALVTAGETFRATINGTQYNYLAVAGNTVQTVVEALAPLMDANADVGCLEDDLKITCTASVAGTAFTFAGIVVDITPPAISSLTLDPSAGTANIGDVITLNIVADSAGFTEGAITVNGESVTGFTDNFDGSYSVTYTVASGDDDRSVGTVPASVVLTDNNANSNTAFTTVTVNTLKIDANAPILVSAETTSTTTIGVTFSEDLNGATVAMGDFTVASNTIVAKSELNGVVTLTLGTPINTAATPLVTLVGMVEDLAGNGVSTGSVTPTDGVAPILAEVTPVTTPANDSTPDYTFSSTEAGTITYGGGCSSATTAASSGSNLVTFSSLSDGTYGSCTIQVTDSNSNQSSLLPVSSFTVDTTAPTVSLTSLSPDPTNAAFSVTATFSESVTGFNDSDVTLGNGAISNFLGSGDTYTFTVTPPTDGSVTVDVPSGVAEDSAANNNTAAVQLTRMADLTPPVIAGHADITEEATSASGASVSYTSPTASDNLDADAPASCTPVSSTTFALGTTTVTCTKTDTAGNAATSTSFSIQVLDTTDPSITAPSDVTQEATSPLSNIVVLGSPLASDLVDGSLDVTNDAPATFPVGTTTVTWAATDDSGNSASDDQTVVITDTTPPNITLNGLATTTIWNTNGFNDDGVTATDLGGSVQVVKTGSVNLQEAGVNTLTYTATDEVGLQASVTRDVIVMMAGGGGGSSSSGEVLGAMTDAQTQALIASLQAQLKELLTELLALLQEELAAAIQAQN